MIQRIQSAYLLMAALVVLLVFFFPIALLTNEPNGMFFFRYRGVYELIEGKEILKFSLYPLAILLSLNLLISLITIFKFKNRVLQMRLCFINILLLLGSAGLIYYSAAFSGLNASYQFKFIALMPFIAIILSFLAYKGIQKDEKLIKSIDRIR